MTKPESKSNTLSGTTKAKTTIKKKVGKPKLLLTLPTPANGKSPYLDLENRIDVDVLFRPFFNVEGVSSNNFRKQKLNLKEVTAMILTSKGAIDHLFRLIDELKFKISPDLKYFCKSEAVALYLQKFITFRKRKVFFPKSGKMPEFMEILKKHKEKEKFMYCSSDNTHDRLSNYLAENDFTYQKAVLFEIIPSQEVIDLKKDSWDCIVFFSPNAVKIFLDHQDFFMNSNLKIAAFGPATVEELENNDITVELVAPTPEYPSMCSLLESYYKK